MICAGEVNVGAIISCTVTVAVAEETFPWLSVTVKVTVFTPILLQLKLVVETVILAIPQSSVDPPSTCDAVIVALPLAFRFTVIFFVMAFGLVSSKPG
ncbi:MAG: hypothetical protein AAB212_10915 [Bacteroidota bacterium]